jgi:hypothetical protein
MSNNPIKNNPDSKIKDEDAKKQKAQEKKVILIIIGVAIIVGVLYSIV